MKAAVYEKYGSPDNIVIREVEKPRANGNEILVKVYSTTINGADLDMLMGNTFGRFSGLFKPGHNILGSDVSGVVEAIGKDVRNVCIGDEVFGDMTECGFSTFAEYICVPETALTKKPPNMTFEEAAAIPSAGVIALQAIENKKSIRSGERILINGAGGGMGTFAVQMAKSLGAVVTAVDSNEKLDKLIEIGADEVIDYRKENFTKGTKKYDRIIDCQALNFVFSYNRVLNPGGIYYMIGGAPIKLLSIGIVGSLISMLTSKNIRLLLGRANRMKDMITLIDFFEAGKIRPIIAKTYELNNIAEAFKCFAESKFVGKVIVNIYED